MRSVPTWVWYSVIRVLLFAVPFAVLMIANVPWWLSAAVAALFGLAASLIFLRKPREALSRDIHAARTRGKPQPTVDDDAEDAAVDAAE
ncbi:DUF4229 domain-containing protein [Agromyces sp. MMS24-JH15]|uniref:DUF4229 domain-containing protein n=1 Tax=Agromyces sp. MMS24-JH15 TaxID=3243765 RepID=UPI003747CACD